MIRRRTIGTRRAHLHEMLARGMLQPLEKQHLKLRVTEDGEKTELSAYLANVDREQRRQTAFPEESGAQPGRSAPRST